MKLNTEKNLLIVLALIVTAGCASRYRPVKPESISYLTKSDKSDVELYYRYDILAEAGNVKQVNKELRNDIKLVAVKITNTSNRQFTIGTDAKIYGDNKELRVLDNDALHRELRQSTVLYAGYLALFPLKFSFEINNGKKTVDVFAGAAIGTGIAAGNIYAAAKANKKLRTELEKYNLLNKTILPGETVYGLIGIPATGYVPLSIKFVQ